MPRSTSSRWLAGIALVVTLLVAVSVVITVLAGGRDPELLPEGSPERAVQEYLLAFQDEDYEEAYGLLADELTDQCSLAEFIDRPGFPDDSVVRVRLEEKTETSAGVVVVMEVTNFYGTPPFDGGESTSDYRYLVTETPEGWRLVEAPWPFTPCSYPRAPEPTPTPTPTPSPTPTADAAEA